MKHTIFASLAAASILALMPNCGGGGSSGSSGSGPSTNSGGSGGSGGTATTLGSGGTSSGGTATDASGGTSTDTGGSGGTDATGGTNASGGSGGTMAAGGEGGEAGGGGEGGDPGSGASGGTAGTGGSPAMPTECPETADGLAQAYADMICRKRVECCLDEYYGCMSFIATSIELLFPNAQDAQDSSLAALDCDAFDACAEAIFDAACEDWPMQNGQNFGLAVDQPACKFVMEPLVEPGNQCGAHYHCIDGYCDPSDAENPVCAALVPSSGDCEAATAVCDTTEQFCDDTNTCVDRLADGQECTSGDQCASRICNGDAETPGECVAIAGSENECSYVPSLPPATCSVGAIGASIPGGTGFFLFGMVGMGFGLSRRRRSAQ